MNAKEIRIASVEIVKSAKDLGKLIHSHNIEIVKHIFSEGNGDFTEATFFVTKLRNSDKSIVRAAAVKAWFEAFAGCTWGKTKDGKEGFKKARGMFAAIEADLPANMRAARANPWNVYTKAKAFSFFDLDAAIAALVKRAENVDEVPAELAAAGKGHKINAEHLAKLKDLAAAIAA